MNFKKKITEEFAEKLLDDISDDVLLNSSKPLPAEQEQRIYSKMLENYKSLNKKTMSNEVSSNWMKSLVFLFSGAAVAMLAVVAFNYWQAPQALNNDDSQVVAVIEENNEDLAAAVQLSGTFSFVEGNVQIKKGTEWIDVEIGETISTDDLIQTLSDSKSIITFDDGSILRLDENTYIEIQEANNDNIIVKQVSGQTYSRVNKSHTFEYQIRSLDTTVTALGTAFTINRNHGDDVILKVLESKVKVEKETVLESENEDEVIIEIETLEEVDAGESFIYNASTEIGKKDRLTYEELQDDFYTWNKEEDTKENKPLGFLEEVPPVLVIEEPTNDYTTYEESIVVKGYTDAEAKVTVNEKEVELKEGKFEQAIILEEGENKITIKSVNEYDKATEELLIVTRKIKTATTNPVDTKPSIYVTASSKDGKVYLKWSLKNLYSSKGYKVVVSESAYPVYPGSKYHYKSSPSTTTDTWSDLVSGKTYHFRVCEYLGSKCGTYSNDVKITVQGGAPVQTGSINLNGSVDDNGKVSLNWSLNSMTSSQGYKIVQNKTGSPVYPGDTYHYLSNASTSSDSWTGLEAGKTYYFRVCEYLGGSCGVYSNQITVTIPSVEPIPDPVQTGSIYLHGTVNNDGIVNLDWSLTEMTSSQGFKVVYNKTGNPVYPGSTYHYLSSPSASTDSWTSLAAGETYYFRVCEYLGGSCGVYSNQITITVPASEPVQNGSISLSGSSSDGIVDLNWALNSMTSDQGFKVVYNLDGYPVYPGDPYHYLSNSGTRFDSWTGLTVGETYYFRVCEYLGGSCGVYSNQIVVTVE